MDHNIVFSYCYGRQRNQQQHQYMLLPAAPKGHTDTADIRMEMQRVMQDNAAVYR